MRRGPKKVSEHKHSSRVIVLLLPGLLIVLLLSDCPLQQAREDQRLRVRVRIRASGPGLRSGLGLGLGIGLGLGLGLHRVRLRVRVGL